MRVLEPYFNENFDESYSHLKNKARDILAQQDSLSEIVQLVGKESLSEDQKVDVNDIYCLSFQFHSTPLSPVGCDGHSRDYR